MLIHSLVITVGDNGGQIEIQITPRESRRVGMTEITNHNQGSFQEWKYHETPVLEVQQDPAILNSLIPLTLCLTHKPTLLPPTRVEIVPLCLGN